jgi:hypothetical protein
LLQQPKILFRVILSPAITDAKVPFALHYSTDTLALLWFSSSPLHAHVYSWHFSCLPSDRPRRSFTAPAISSFHVSHPNQRPEESRNGRCGL